MFFTLEKQGILIWKSRNFKTSKNSKIHENHDFWRFCEKWQNHSQIAYINFFIDQKNRFFVFFVFFHEKRPFLDKTVHFRVLRNRLINDWWPQKTIQNWSKWTKNDQKTSKNTKIGQKSCFSWFFMKTVIYHTSQTLSKVPYFQL